MVATIEAAQSLDTLAATTLEVLARCYTEAPTPRGIEGLAGDPKGRMLAVRGMGGAVARGLKNVAAAQGFPWGGKSFSDVDATRGLGINRVRLWGRHRLFPFETRLAPSVIDGRGCVMLDYDLEDNPGLIRRIHDEIREVSPGLWLGPAMWKGEGTPALVLWFALDWRR